jgi:hypothetical protein
VIDPKSAPPPVLYFESEEDLMAQKANKDSERKKKAVKKKFAIMQVKGRTLDPEDITVRTTGSRAPSSALLGGRLRRGLPVIVADMDPRDGILIYDTDPDDAHTRIDMDPTDPIANPPD